LRREAGWIVDRQGNPERDNSSNVRTFLRIANVELRHNAWANRDEIRKDEGEWRALTDPDIDVLMTAAADTTHKFRPTADMFKRTMRAIAREAIVDPVLERLTALEAAWDRKPRLDQFLHLACGVEDNPYHRAVSANLVGGMIKRARGGQYGVKHDECVILCGEEDLYKSTLFRKLAMEDAWFSDSFCAEQSPQNLIPQTFGKLSLELSDVNMSARDARFWKRWISSQADNFALKYRALAEEFPRRGIYLRPQIRRSRCCPMMATGGSRLCGSSGPSTSHGWTPTLTKSSARLRHVIRPARSS
jgi:predicted P-loop ATPase